MHRVKIHEKIRESILNPVCFLRWRRYCKARDYFIRLGSKNLVEQRIIGENASINTPSHIYGDLWFLHRFLMKKRPSITLEMGCGMSTIVMADALYRLTSKNKKPRKIYVVEALESWAKATQLTLPDHLKPFVDFTISPVSVIELNGQLCHRYEKLPDVVPNFLYLDGPNPLDVEGEKNGLSFKKGRYVMAADPLFYESSFPSGFVMMIDGRYSNMCFLKNNLKRKYSIIHNRTHNFSTFVLQKKSSLYFEAKWLRRL